MARWSRTMIRFRWAVLGAWIVLFVAAGAAASGLSDLLTNRFVLPGAESEKAGKILEDHFGQKPQGSFSLVVQGAPGRAQELVGPTRAAASRAAKQLPTGKLVDVRPVSGDVVTASIASELQPADAKGHTDEMREAAGQISGARAYLTGQSAIESDLEPVQNRDLQVGELYIAIPVALAILVFVFGTLAFLLPFMLAAFAIPVTLGLIWIFANFMTLSTYLTNMVALSGFGLAGLLIPLVSVLAAVTLLPVLLYWLEDRLDRVRLVPRKIVERREDQERNFWARLAETIMRRPVVFAVGTTAVLLALATPLTALELGPGSNEGVPQHLEAVKGLNVLSGAVGEGAISPTDIVVDTGRAGGADDPGVQAGKERLASLLRGDSEVAEVVAAGPQTIDPSGRYLHIQAIGKHEYGLPPAQEFVDRLRDVIVPAAAFPSGVAVLAGGGPPFGVDFLDMTYGAFPWLVLAVLLLTYILLVRAFRSLLLPLKAIILNLLSIGAAYGLLVAAFKLGWGEPFGLTQFDQIEGWIPVFLFAMLFGLSMDYEVFLVARMREEWDKRADNVAAVTTGLAKTGFGLAVAILIDVTIIRALLVPSAMKLFGRWNWWLPPRAARVFRVEPSPLAPRPAAALRTT